MLTIMTVIRVMTVRTLASQVKRDGAIHPFSSLKAATSCYGRESRLKLWLVNNTTTTDSQSSVCLINMHARVLSYASDVGPRRRRRRGREWFYSYGTLYDAGGPEGAGADGKPFLVPRGRRTLWCYWVIKHRRGCNLTPVRRADAFSASIWIMYKISARRRDEHGVDGGVECPWSTARSVFEKGNPTTVERLRPGVSFLVNSCRVAVERGGQKKGEWMKTRPEQPPETPPNREYRLLRKRFLGFHDGIRVGLVGTSYVCSKTCVCLKCNNM